MSNTFGFLSDDTFAAKLDELNGHLSDIAAAQIKGTKVTSWKTVQRLVRAGVADKAFAIGDQLTCSKGDDVLTWDIIGIDVDTPADSQYTHSMTLQLHDCLPNSMQFDAPEAMYYAAEELAAGTYHVTPTGGFNTTGMGNGKTYQFPLTKAVPKGGQIYWYGSWNKDPLNYDIYTYASATSTTEIETVAPPVSVTVLRAVFFVTSPITARKSSSSPFMKPAVLLYQDGELSKSVFGVQKAPAPLSLFRNCRIALSL